MPVFWKKEGESYFLKTVTKLIPLPMDWPVEINNLEATAFCRWKSLKTGVKVRLPTEDEIFCLKKNYLNEQNEKNSNKNLNFWLSPCPVDMFQFGQHLYDVTGNLWQLTSTKFNIFEGFQPHPLYEDFTLPFVQDQKHYLMIGNSFASFGASSSFEYRNPFRRHFHQASGLRYVEESTE